MLKLCGRRSLVVVQVVVEKRPKRKCDPMGQKFGVEQASPEREGMLFGVIAPEKEGDHGAALLECCSGGTVVAGLSYRAE